MGLPEPAEKRQEADRVLPLECVDHLSLAEMPGRYPLQPPSGQQIKISVSEASALHQMRPTILKLAADVYVEDLLSPLARDGVLTDEDIRAVQQPRDIFDQLIELLERVELRAGGFVGMLRALSTDAVDQAPIADELRELERVARAEHERETLKEFYDACGGERWQQRVGWDGRLVAPKTEEHGEAGALQAPDHGHDGKCNSDSEYTDTGDADNGGGSSKETGGGRDQLARGPDLGSWYGCKTGMAGTARGLTELDLAANGLVGTIPEVLLSLQPLKLLSLRNNALVGELPAAIGQLSALETLMLGGNRLEGELPGALWHCTALTRLDLGANLFSGQVLHDLPATADGDLKGDIDSGRPQSHGRRRAQRSLGACVMLQELSLANNLFDGRIPSELRYLSRLRVLDLSENRFDGRIPAELGQCLALEELDLSQNDLSGPLPGALLVAPRLSRLLVRENRLSGPLPPELGDCGCLRELCLQSNTFEGGFPPRAFAGLTALEKLEAGHNGLTGALPQTLGLCRRLRALRLRDNSMEGPLPLNAMLTLPELAYISLRDNVKLGCCTVAARHYTRDGDVEHSEDGRIVRSVWSSLHVQRTLPSGWYTLRLLPSRRSLSSCKHMESKAGEEAHRECRQMKWGAFAAPRAFAAAEIAPVQVDGANGNHDIACLQDSGSSNRVSDINRGVDGDGESTPAVRDVSGEFGTAELGAPLLVQVRVLDAAAEGSWEAAGGLPVPSDFEWRLPFSKYLTPRVAPCSQRFYVDGPFDAVRVAVPEGGKGCIIDGGVEDGDELENFCDYVHCTDASPGACNEVSGVVADCDSFVGGYIVLEADGVDYARKSLVHTFGDRLKLSF